jgi:hypothetical protein
LSVTIGALPEAVKEILGIDLVSEVGDEAHVGLIGAREIQDGQTGFPFDIGEELVKPIAVPGHEVLGFEDALGRKAAGCPARDREFGQSGLRLHESPKSFT